MANNLESNFTRQIAERVLDPFENMRVLSRAVNTQLLEGKFNPSTGDDYDFKRPTDYIVQETADGDISATTASDIIRGKATGTVQNYITVEVNYDEVDEALKMDNDENEFFDSMAQRAVTKLETNFAAFMMKNSGLLSGVVGTAADAWSDVAKWGATLKATGVPANACYGAVNSYTQAELADMQKSLGAGGSAGTLISEAFKNATIATGFGGLDAVLTADTLSTYTLPATGDLVGAVDGAPTPTYVAAKDSMTQSITVDGFGSFTGTIPAGAVVKVTGVNRLNLATREPVIDATGANIVYSGTVTADAALTSGAGTLVVTGPAIYEATGAYNTVHAAIADNDVITIQGADSTTYQPNLFWHKNAFAIGSVPIKKLHSTDTVFTTKDGLQLRVSMGSSIRENKQIVRIDLHPAFAALNPFFAGHGWGN